MQSFFSFRLLPREATILLFWLLSFGVASACTTTPEPGMEKDASTCGSRVIVPSWSQKSLGDERPQMPTTDLKEGLLGDLSKIVTEQQKSLWDDNPQTATTGLKEEALKDLPKIMTEQQCKTYPRCEKLLRILESMISSSNDIVRLAKNTPQQQLNESGRESFEFLVASVRRTEEMVSKRITNSPRLENLRKVLLELEAIRLSITPRSTQ